MDNEIPKKRPALFKGRRRADSVFQFTLVVLGALLALGFSQWKDQRNDRARAQAALESIRSELRANRNEVLRAQRYHATLADRFDRLQQQGATQPRWEDFPQGLLSPARVVSTAWQSSLTTGAAAQLPYSQLLVLSSIYETQASYARLSDALLASTYQDLMRGGAQRLLNSYANFAPVQRDFSGKEAELLQAYDSALRKLDTPGPDTSPGRGDQVEARPQPR